MLGVEIGLASWHASSIAKAGNLTKYYSVLALASKISAIDISE